MHKLQHLTNKNYIILLIKTDLTVLKVLYQTFFYIDDVSVINLYCISQFTFDFVVLCQRAGNENTQS